MCGRFFLYTDIIKIAKELGINATDVPDEVAKLKPSYNIAPTNDVLVAIADDKKGAVTLKTMRWGLVPHWAKEEKIGYRMINARAESLAEKPAFREPYKDKRCLVIADGFYEWDKKKQPFAIQSDKGIITMAGLWDEWDKQHAGKPLRTITIVTTNANHALAPIHDRMPVIIAKEDRKEWLDANNHDTARLQLLLHPDQGSKLKARKVSKDVNSPVHNGPQLLK